MILGKLKNQEGKEIDLNKIEDFVLFFYSKNFTPGCTIECLEFKKLYPKFKKLGFKVFGVCTGSLSSHKNFHKKLKLPFDLLLDENGKISKKLKIWKEKKFFGKKFGGIIRSTLIVKDGKKFKFLKNVKAKDHAKNVLNIISSIPRS